MNDESIYRDGTHAVRNALTCLLAIRNAVDNGAIALTPNGEAPGNYAHVVDAIEWLKKHPQAERRAGPPTARAVADTMPAHDSPPVTTGAAACTIRPPQPGECCPMCERPVTALSGGNDYGCECGAWRLKDGTWAAPPAPPPTRYPHDHTGKPVELRPLVDYFRIVTDDQDQFRFEWWSDQHGWTWVALSAMYKAAIALTHRRYTLADALNVWELWRRTRGNEVELITSTANPHGEAPVPVTPTDPFVSMWRGPVYVTPVTLSADTNVPQHDETFRIMPNVLKPDDGWSIRQWRAERRKWTNVGMATFGDYWAACDRLCEIAIERKNDGYPTYLVTPSARDLEYWKDAGFEIKAPPIVAVDVDTDDGTVTVAGTADKVTEAAQEILRTMVEGASVELKLPQAPAPEIGTKIPVPMENGYWAVDEWTATGWNRVADDLDWDKVEQALRPGVVLETITTDVGTCEIRPGNMPGDVWDVYQWTGTTWKQIAGGVTRRTAEGVVTARKNDPENPSTTAPINRVAQHRSTLRNLKGLLEKISANVSHDAVDTGEIEKLSEDALKIINDALKNPQR